VEMLLTTAPDASSSAKPTSSVVAAWQTKTRLAGRFDFEKGLRQIAAERRALKHMAADAPGI